MQMLVRRYLEISIDSLTREQEKFRQHMSQTCETGSFAPLEELARQNMEMFQRTFAMFAPFARRQAEIAEAEKSGGSGSEIDELKRSPDDVQSWPERLSDAEK
jgi:polyhydroxyalkanoate synthesis regulator protein